jgi:hypothetical protein
MASREDRQLLGRTEFAVRDHVHRLGAQVLESVLQERKKKVSGDEYRLSGLRGARALRRLPRQNDRELAGGATRGAALLPLCPLWAGCLSVGRGVRGDGNRLESRGGRSDLYRRGAE